MSLADLQKQMLAFRQKLLNDLEKEAAEEHKKLNNARKQAQEAEKAARNAERQLRKTIREAQAAAKKNKPVGTRKRHPGANYEIAGKPEHLAPGAPYRRVEGKQAHVRSTIQTRSKKKQTNH